MTIPRMLLPLLLLAACTRVAPVQVDAAVDESLARSLLNELAEQQRATIERSRAEGADVLWASDPADVLRRAAAGELAPLTEAMIGRRPPTLVDPQHRWAAVAAIGRVIVYDPDRLPDDGSPTRVLDLARPELARQLVLAEPTRGAALWHAAALSARLGDADALRFFRGLRDGGARLVADEDTVGAALIAGDQALALIDSDRAYAAQTARPRLVITIPDQGDDGSGVFVLPSVVALTARGARNPRAVELAAALLAQPQAFRIALAGNAFVVAADGTSPPSLLNVDQMKLMPVDYADIVDRLSKVRTALVGVDLAAAP
ncbi:ABC transporter substrate-binding protein [bacterium]|nr:ABC transporter substrate-binding protein [bacterium]